MGKIALVFPGQGAQAVGMGRDVFDNVPAARDIFDAADRELGFKLTELMFDGPDTELKQTINTQPALLTTSYALYKALQQHEIQPDFVAGHSLGEYSALVVAGVMSFADAVSIVRKRGQFMEEAVPFGQGAMAAVLAADRTQLGALCDDISSLTDTATVQLANVNCPGQIVISGTVEGVQAVAERGKEAGAKRVKLLEVSGPFHSTLMKPAAERLSKELLEVSMRDASIPIVANVTARAEQQADAIRNLLVEQVYSPVLWEDSVRYMIDQGVDTFIEIGSGSVLSGLIKKIDNSVRIVTINSLAAVESFKLES
ncbi:ACP S-malonyltransferase [Paenibacillus sp. 481]|uniref:ACP S-malonyltransferase n=1 Tax=Paenibacillus sp. 481 TaxID=2835869 RepID=UPI001E3C1847|nr:ACP S-malonyltransferase [Paenibacillus sp. 481]UHA73981.1 ACP S-malonyltransferase [Paenibacillus sp. 481]